jgi:DNA-binding IclR family transcriptional regulator
MVFNMANTKTDPRSKAPSVTQAVAILRYLAAQPGPSGVVTIARALAISPSSCFNILKVLSAESFASFDEVKKTYTLGSGAVGLARHALDPERAGYIGRDILIELAGKFEATCTMWRVRPQEQIILLVALEASDRAATLRMQIGQRLPIMLGANGRAIMATTSSPPGKLKLSFKKLRWDAPPTFEDYMRQVEMARSAGWALDDGAYVRGVASTASAVTDQGGDPQFTVAVTLLGGPHDKAYLTQVGKATAGAAKRMSLMLYGDMRRR